MWDQEIAGSGLVALAESMWPQEAVGVGGSLLLRLARFLGGDPAQWINPTSASGVPALLPDNTAAQSAVLTVTGNACQYRIDGSAPIATDPTLAVGTIITLTGRPTLIAFRFTSTGPGSAVLAGAYYT